MNYAHEGLLSEYRIKMQAPSENNYPNCVSAPIFAAWQYPIMGDSVFDRQLVRAKMKETKTSQAEMARLLNLPSQSAMHNILAVLMAGRSETFGPWFDKLLS